MKMVAKIFAIPVLSAAALVAACTSAQVEATAQSLCNGIATAGTAVATISGAIGASSVLSTISGEISAAGAGCSALASGIASVVAPITDSGNTASVSMTETASGEPVAMSAKGRRFLAAKGVKAPAMVKLSFTVSPAGQVTIK